MTSSDGGPARGPKVVVTPISVALGDPTAPVNEKISAKETLVGVWLGQAGALRFEVCEIVSSEEPSIQTIRSVWHKRRARRAVPLIVFWQGPDRVLLTEPIGEPASVPVLQVDPSAALSVIKRALSAPQREAVQAALALLERTQGSGGVAGFRNRNLLSTHYLTQGFRRDHEDEWLALDNAGAEYRTNQGGKLLRVLGYSPTNHPSTFEVSENGRCLVHALVLPDGSSFDRSAAGPGDAPATRILVEARSKGAERAVLISGGILRLYFAKSTQGLNDLATAGTYIELDLDILGAEWSALLGMLFAADSHKSTGVFNRVVVESDRYAIGLRERFRDRIYDEVVSDLVLALYDARGRKRADADLLFNATLRLLYRILFVLYAEDRNLLPLENPEYRRVSLTETLFRINKMQEDGKPFDPRQTTLWDDMFRVFEAIRSGNIEWNVPAYNGGLFEPALTDHKEAAFLTSIKVPNATLAPLLLALAYDEQDGRRGKVDFGDLGVRHLGTLYEGLLSYSVHLAEQDLVVDATGMYVPAKKKDEPDVLAGDPYITSPKGGRKTSGSYYTPSFIVRRLIENSLSPILEQHLDRVSTLPIDKQWEAMLDFRVVDPAMGSGHFLVDALDAIADRLARYLRDNPRISAKPIEQARNQITEIGKEYGIENLGKGVGDFELLRRNVMRNCIYGVDLNPMAVELAKLGLWLHAFVPGLPLSYLGHNLQHGNALVGIIGHEIEKQVEGNLFGNAVKDSLAEALRHSRNLSALGDLSIDEVKRSEQAQDQLEDATSGLRGAFDAYCCRVFAVGDEDEEKKIREQGRGLLEGADGLQQVLTGKVGGRDKRQIAKAQRAAVELHSFHWQLAFPEVFLRKYPGFDAVLGNPPWEEVTTEELGYFAPYLPGIKDINSQTERAKMIKALVRRRPDIEEAYLAQLEQTEEFRQVLKSNFELTRSGDPDLYRSFAERALYLCREIGAIGMLYPHSLVTSDGTAPYRSKAFPDHRTVVDFAVNANGWLFADVHPQYMVIALSRLKGHENVSTGGPVADIRAWDEMPANRVDWKIEELATMSSGLELPLMPTKEHAILYKKMLANGQAFRDSVEGVRFRPWTEFHGTNDRKTGMLKEDGKGWPAYKGDNFDLWEPERGVPPFTVDPKQGLADLQRKRLRSDVWSDFSAAALGDLETLPPNQCHILFRDVTNRLNSRSVIACLVPPGRFAVNNAPVLLCVNGGYQHVALRLGIMCSIVFDWAARRRIERHLNFFILNALPVPSVGLEDARAQRVVKVSATLAAQDKRFSAFASECGVEIGEGRADSQDALLAELDALVASLYGLNETDIQTVFADFSLLALSNARRDATIKKFRSLQE